MLSRDYLYHRRDCLIVLCIPVPGPAWPFQGGTSFVDLLCFCSVLCLLCFVCVCLYVLCGHLLGKGWPIGFRLWCLLWVCHFPIGILGQVWYLIVSIPDLCNLITLVKAWWIYTQISLLLHLQVLYILISMTNSSDQTGKACSNSIAWDQKAPRGAVWEGTICLTFLFIWIIIDV